MATELSVDTVPALKCVLTHWYQLRLRDEPLGAENSKRLVAIKGLHMVFRRQGADALRGQLLQAARSAMVAEPAHLPVGAGLFSENVAVETFVRRSLHHQRAEYRVAAAYGALFFIRRSEEVAFILSERVVLAEEDPLVVAAARDALEIWRATKDGGRCSRCGLTGGSPSTLKQQDWMVARAS